MLTPDQIKVKVENYLFENLSTWRDHIDRMAKSDAAKKEFRQFIAQDLSKKAKMIVALIDHLMGYTKDFDQQTQLLLEALTLLDCINAPPENGPSSNSITPNQPTSPTTKYSPNDQSQLDKLNQILSEVPPSHASPSFE